MSFKELLVGLAMLLLGTTAAAEGPADATQAVVEARPDAVVRALEAAIILSGQEGGDIRLAVWDGIFRRANGGAWVALVVEVEGPALLQDQQGESLAVDLHLYALGEDHEVSTALSRQVRIDLTQHREIVEASGLKVPWLVSLPAGSHLLRLLVRTGEKAFGIRSLQVSVAARTSEDSVTLPPVFPDRSGGWLVAIPGDRDPTDAPPWLPFVNDAPEFLPAALPVLRRGDTPRGLIYLAATAAMPTELEAVLRPAFAETVIRLPLAILDRRPCRSGHLEIVEFELPEVDLPSGVYTGVIHLNPGSEDQAATSSFNLVVGDDSETDLWPQLDLESTDPSSAGRIVSTSTIETKDPSHRVQALADQEIIQKYHEALTHLADDEFGIASTRLMTLEEQSAGARDRSGLRRLEESQYRVHSSLARQGADLFPVMVLHALSTETYRTAGKSHLVRHSIRVIRHLAGENLHQDLDADARVATADLLAEVGTGEAEFGNLAPAVLLFEAALACTRQHPGALLGLATVFERQGLYGDAAWLLDELWTQEPDYAEAGLRLGINLARQSQTKRARVHLTRLAADGTEPWIARLAYQELAKLELDRRPQEAIRILQEGLATWPDDFNLSVQLAYSLDSVGRPREALHILSSLAQAPKASADPSPRWLYHQPPNWSLTKSLDALVSRAREWLPDLQEALASTGHNVAQR